jgi:hypothetical protein
VEDRWCRLYAGFIDGAAIPPVQLYKIKDDYFVYDGNHRISVAKFLKFGSIEAEVTEFIASNQDKESIIYREKFIFEKTTGIENIIFTETGQYHRLIKEITDYRDYFIYKEGKKLEFPDASAQWMENIYTPASKIIEENKILEKFPERTYGDIFIYFLDHKYFESEKKGSDIGFSYALIDFINKFGFHDENIASLKINLNENVVENLKILLEVDKKKYLDYNIIRKNSILREITNVDFNHNFLILFEIDEYIGKKGIQDFKEGAQKWFEEVFKWKVDYFVKKVKLLPKPFSEKIGLFQSSMEKLFFAVQNYETIYENIVDRNSNFEEIVANYLLDIYIPVVDIMTKRDVADKDFEEEYYGVQGRFNFLREYKPDLTIYEAADSYFREESKKYQKIHDWFLFKFNDTPKSEILIDYVVGKFELKLSDKNFFKKLLEKYGKPNNYATIFRLEKFMDDYNKYNSEKEWLKEKVAVDLEKLSSSNDIRAYFMTKNIIDTVKADKVELNIIDYYAEIISFGGYLGKDLSEVDIIDLWIEYKKSKG